MTRKQRKDREYQQRIKREFIRNLRKLRECIRKRCRLLKV